MQVRFATHADIPTMIEMARALHAESPRYSRLSFAPEKLERLALHLMGTLSTGMQGALLVAEHEGEVAGMFVGFVAEQFFGYDKVASDYTFYVKPEYRGSSAAVRLLSAFERWAVEQGAVDILPGVSTCINTDQTRRFYEKRGYEVYGVAMLKKAD